LAGVFISYRREDAAGWTGRVYDRAVAQLGVDHVFMDIDDIPIGADFSEVISRTLEKVDAMVVMIGPNWLSASDHEGRRRLDDPADYVRREVMGALQKGALVVPVLVDNAPMPADRDLPEELKPLAYRNAVVISDIRFDYDVGRLVDALERVTAEAQAKAEAEAEEQARREAEEAARLEAEEKARREAEQKAQQEAEAKTRRQAEEKSQREAEERARADREADVWAKAQRETEEAARREAEERVQREAEEATRREAAEAAQREAEERTRPEADAPVPRAGKTRRLLWGGAVAVSVAVFAFIAVTMVGGDDGPFDVNARSVLFKEEFDASSAAWSGEATYESGTARIVPSVCFNRQRSLSGSGALFLFSIEGATNIDFGLFTSGWTAPSGRGWDVFVRGPGDDIRSAEFVAGEVSNEVLISGQGEIAIGGLYHLLLEHDGARFTVALWDAEARPTEFVREVELSEDWVGREWTTGLCVIEGTLVLHEYQELE
jgi:hypothetical protein